MSTSNDVRAATGTSSSSSAAIDVSSMAADEELLAAATWCRVRVHGPEGALDVTLPTQRTVTDLVGELTSSLLPGAPLRADAAAWQLHRVGRDPLDADAPFGDALPRDGEVFHLSAERAPQPARRVDDAFEALAGAAASAGRWSPVSLARAAGVGAVAASATLALTLLVVRPGGAALPLLLAAGLLTTALMLRREPSAADLGSGVAAAASLPAWVAAGVALATANGAALVPTLTLAGAALALGGVAAAATVPRLAPWWALAATSGALVMVGGGVVTLGLLGSRAAAAVLATAVLVGLAALPWTVARSARWSSPTPPAGGGEELAAVGRRTRAVVTAVSVSAAAAVGVCALVLATSGDGLQQWLAAVLALVLALRARRSRFVVESGAMLASGLAPLALLAVVVAAGSGTGLRWLVVVALLGLVAGLLAVRAAARRADAGDASVMARMNRAKVRRTLGVLEGLAAIAVLPLLLGVLEVYEAAANAGSQL